MDVSLCRSLYVEGDSCDKSSRLPLGSTIKGRFKILLTSEASRTTYSLQYKTSLTSVVLDQALDLTPAVLPLYYIWQCSYPVQIHIGLAPGCLVAAYTLLYTTHVNHNPYQGHSVKEMQEAFEIKENSRTRGHAVKPEDVSRVVAGEGLTTSQESGYLSSYKG